jgi:hypothetical protein
VRPLPNPIPPIVRWSLDHPLATVAVAAGASHAVYFLLSGVTETSDTISYTVPAEQIAAGNGFVDAAGDPETFRTPGYPLFLSLFYLLRAAPAILPVQHVLAVAVSVALTFFIVRATSHRAMALVAGLYAGCDPTMTVMANMVMPEMVFTLLVFGSFVATYAIRRRPERALTLAAAAGSLAAAAALTRPVAILLFVPIALALLPLTRRTAAAMLVAATAAVSIQGAWVLRNHRETGVPLFARVAGQNMLFYRGAPALAMAREPGFPIPLPPYEGEERYRFDTFRVIHPQLDTMMRAELARRGFEPGDLEELSRLQSELGTGIILAHPWAYTRVATNGAIHMMLDGGWEAANVAGWPQREVLAWGIYITSVLAALLSIAGLRRLWTIDRSLFWLVALFIAYFLAMSSGIEATLYGHRFRTPIMPFYSIAVAAGLIAAVETVRSRRMQRRERAGRAASR